MFSKACEYGIKAMVYIADQSLQEKRVKIGDIARYTDSPEPFTSKILSLLTKHNLLQSVKGPHGGFSIGVEKMKVLQISEIVSAIDGKSIYKSCALGFKECDNKNPCPLHDKFLNVRNGLKTILESTTIYDLAIELKHGKTSLIG